jgi:hypothetical protein
VRGRILEPEFRSQAAGGRWQEAGGGGRRRKAGRQEADGGGQEAGGGGQAAGGRLRILGYIALDTSDMGDRQWPYCE